MDKINSNSNSNLTAAANMLGGRTRKMDGLAGEIAGEATIPAETARETGEGSDSFQGQLAQAGAAAHALQAQPALAVPTGTGTPVSEGIREASQPKGLRGLEGSHVPLTGKAAASSTTASALTGLKPWSSEWVFGDSMGEGVKPLFSHAEPAGEAAKAGLAAELKGEKVSGDVQPGLPAAPQGQPQRGDALDARGAQPQARAAESLLRAMSALEQTEQAGKTPEAEKPSLEQLRTQLAQALHEEGLQARAAHAGSVAEAVRALHAQDGVDAQAQALARAAVQAGLLPSGFEKPGAQAIAARLEAARAMPRAMQGEEAPRRNVEQSLAGALSGAEFLHARNAAHEAPQGVDPRLSRLRLIEGGQPGLEGTADEIGKPAKFGGQLDFDSERLRALHEGHGEAQSPLMSQVPQLHVGQLAHLGQLGPSGSVGSRDAWAARPPVELTGHVTQGAMAQDRLTTVSLTGMSAAVRDLTAQGGGEIRVRLKPDNLGELNLRVTTRGNEVGLQIQASNEHAKHVLEASIGSLKEGLAAQSLHLGALDVSVLGQSQNPSGSFGDNRQGFAQGQHQRHDLGQQWLGQGQSQHGGRQYDAWQGEGNSSARPAPIRMATSAPLGARRSEAGNANGRLDVLA